MPFRHMRTTKPATIAASKNDNATEGLHVRGYNARQCKIAVDTIVPTPNARKSRTRNVRFK